MRVSAGLLVHRTLAGEAQALLAHPGGPFWRRRDLGSWSIPKGLIEPGEEPLTAAIREFHEETGYRLAGPFRPLTPVRQKGGKTVMAWAVEADLDTEGFRPGLFEMEWPPGSGLRAQFPEIDQLTYFPLEEALRRVIPGQAPLVREALAPPSPGPRDRAGG